MHNSNCKEKMYLAFDASDYCLKMYGGKPR